MTRHIPPCFFFDETSADEDMMTAKRNAEIAEDALWAAECAYKDVYEPGAERAAMRAAIKAYHASLDTDVSGTLAELRQTLAEARQLVEDLS